MPTTGFGVTPFGTSMFGSPTGWVNQTDQVRWARAMGSGHRPVTSLHVVSQGTEVAQNVPFISGEVVDEKVNGIRRHLTVTVPPTRQWLRWLDLPGLEFRPWRGIQFSPTNTVWYPLGVFPVLPPARSYPAAPIQITADDYWQRVVQDNFMGPTTAYMGAVRDVIQRLTTESLGWVGSVVVQRVSNTATVGASSTDPLVWTKTRAETILGYLDAAGAISYLDRYGTLIIKDAGNGVTGPVLSDGVGGTVISVTRTPDWSGVRNVVSARSSAQGIDFGNAIAVISDPNHPASPQSIGRQVEQFASPLLFTYAQGLKAAQTILARKSAAARSYVITCVPDPSRDAGDLVQLSTPFGVETVVIQKITHPLTKGVAQTITTGAISV